MSVHEALAREMLNGKEFIPNAGETWKLILESYNIQNNFVVKFKDDEIDQSKDLQYWLSKRGCDVRVLNTAGNHLTPNTLSSNDILLKELEFILNKVTGASDANWERRDQYAQISERTQGSKEKNSRLLGDSSTWDTDDL